MHLSDGGIVVVVYDGGIVVVVSDGGVVIFRGGLVNIIDLGKEHS